MAKNNNDEQESKVVVATSNMELLNEVFKQNGMPSFEEQFQKMVKVIADNYKDKEEGSSSPTTEEGQDG